MELLFFLHKKNIKISCIFFLIVLLYTKTHAIRVYTLFYARRRVIQ